MEADLLFIFELKKMNLMRKLLYLLPIAMALQSCHFGGTAISENQNIDYDTRSEIRALNEKFFKVIVSADTVLLRSMVSKPFLETAQSTAEVLSLCKKYITNDTFYVKDEYKVHYTGFGHGLATVPGESGDNAYYFHFMRINRDSYIAMLVSPNTRSEWLVNIIYGKYGSEWMVDGFQIGHYSIFQKTAPVYYRLAKESYKQSHLVDAVNYMRLCKDCSKPGNNLFQYKLDKEMESFYNKVTDDAENKYKLPLTLEHVKTHPKVFKILPFCVKDEGYFPMVAYTTSVSMNDTVALKAENNEVRREVDKIFTGISENKKYVLYTAYNEIPGGLNNPERRAYIDTVGR